MKPVSSPKGKRIVYAQPMQEIPPHLVQLPLNKKLAIIEEYLLSATTDDRNHLLVAPIVYAGQLVKPNQ